MNEQNEVLKAELKRIKLLLSTFGIGVWDYDINEDRLVWDDTQYVLHDILRSEFTGKGADWYKLIHPEDVQRCAEVHNEALKSGSSCEYSFRIIRKNGTITHLRSRSVISRDAQGVARYMIGINYEITNIIQGQERLKMIEALVNASPDIFGIASPKGEMLFLNTAAVQLGWAKDKSFGDIFPIESIAQYQQEIFPVLKEKGHWNGEVLFKDSTTGDEFPVSQHSFLLRNSSGRTTAVATIASDLREKKKFEAEMEAQRLKVFQNSKMTSLGEMAAGMAHEINNPLAIIKGNVALLSMQMDDETMDRDHLRKSLNTIDQTVDRIAAIIKSLRSFAKDGSQDPLINFNVGRMVESTLGFFRTRFSSAGVKLTVKNDDDTMIAHGRQVQLSQALVNLLSNAYDAVKDEQFPELVIEVSRAGSTACIKVIDSGPGVPANLKDKILEPFFTTKEVGKGTGLGLSVTKGIIEAHKGRLFLADNAPRTTFVIELPLVI